LDPDSYKSDPENCGSCGHECPSDICQASECVGARFGNIALICMDFNTATADSAPTTLLGNAVFAPAKNPVRVLSYTRGALASAVNRVHQVVSWAGSARGRSAEITEAKTVSAVSDNLNVKDYDVLLIHDLDQAKSGDPAAAGTTWASAGVLSSFARAGGVIVVIDGGDGTGEMHELINAGNLLDLNGKLTIDGQTDITGAQVWNNAAGDALGVNVLSPFLGTSHTCTFDTKATESNELIFVLGDQDASEMNADPLPVAIHHVIRP
jgi:hypothetical protein